MIRLDRLSPHHLQAYYGQALKDGRLDGGGGLSSTSLAYHHRIISKALKDAVRAGNIGRNVAEAVDKPRVQRKTMETLTLKDVPKFFEAALKTPYYRLFYTALMTGARHGELLGLPWSAVNLEQGYISIFQELFKRSGTCVIKDV